MDRRKFVKRTLVFATFGAVTANSVAHAQGRALDRTILFYARTATDKGVRFLRQRQSRRGDWTDGGHGTAALGLRAFATSYQAYRSADGPFITKPMAILTEMLDQSATPGLRDMTLAVLALRELDEPALRPLLASTRERIAERILDVDLQDASGQIQLFYALDALRESDVDPVRRRLREMLLELQKPDGAFQALGGGEADPILSFAGLRGLYLSGAEPASDAVQRGLDWVINSYSPDLPPGDDLSPPGFYREAIHAGMLAAERLGAGERLGDSMNWRDTLAYAILLGQHDDGGWASGRSTFQRTTTTAVNVATLSAIMA